MPPEPFSPGIVRFVEDRARGRCGYCRSPAAYSAHQFHLDHIVPESAGGPGTRENLAYACGCNSYKHSHTHWRDPETGRQVALFDPRRQRWSRHFAWSEDRLLIIGCTAAGRATVDLLRMNRPGLVNLRRILDAVGEHPADQA